LGWIVLGAGLVLTCFGLVGVYAGEAGAETPASKTIRQLAFLAVGLGGFWAVQVVGYRRLGRWAYVMFAVALVLLTLLVIARKVPMAPFIHPRRNAYRWIFLGPISLQVSDVTKIAYILALSEYLRFRTNYRTLRGLLVPFALTLVPTALILKEPDLGTSMLLLPTLFVMLFAAGARIKHLVLILVLGAVAVPAFYYSPLMNAYQRQRVQSLFRQDESDKHWRQGAGYQLHQSKIAIGSGRVFGQGFRGGAFFRHHLLPEEHNDFIFAVVGHQWGLVGCAAMLLCYLVIVAGGLTIASLTTDSSGRLLAVGLCAIITVQMLINMSMTIGLMPITGMSLPFVSMGGSGLATHYLALGLLADVARRRHFDVARKPFEFDGEDETV
jgi:cell division protein FtsW (lipid II flippase)